MFQFSGRIGFGVNVGDLLELQRPFHRHRELRATPQEQGVILLGEQFGNFLHGRVHGQRFTQACRQAAQLFNQFCFHASAQRALDLPQ